MLPLIFCLLISFTFSFALTKVNIGLDEVNKIQKIHLGKSVRLGGIAIFFTILIGIYVFNKDMFVNNPFIILVLFLALLTGIIEDLTGRLNAKTRLFFLTIVAFIITFYLDVRLNAIKIHEYDALPLAFFFSMIISLIIFVGMANAFNMIDGVNGLSSGNGIVILISMMLFNEINNINYDKVFFIIIISSLTGFWIINVINGKLFLGDGGAYFIGFLIAYLGLEQYKNNFDFVKLCIFFSYPTLEIFTTCMFRLIKKQKLLFPDKNHLHSILYEKLISLDKIPVKVVNSLSGIILVVFSFIPMLLICYISNSIVSIVLILMMLSIFIYFKFKGQFLYAND